MYDNGITLYLIAIYVIFGQSSTADPSWKNLDRVFAQICSYSTGSAPTFVYYILYRSLMLKILFSLGLVKLLKKVQNRMMFLSM